MTALEEAVGRVGSMKKHSRPATNPKNTVQ